MLIEAVTRLSAVACDCGALIITFNVRKKILKVCEDCVFSNSGIHFNHINRQQK